MLFHSLIALLVLFSGCQDTPALELEFKTAMSKHNYTIWTWNDLDMDWTMTRPSPDDETIHMCIPSAFTELSSNRVQGTFSDNGNEPYPSTHNPSVGGVCLIEDGEMRLLTKGEAKLAPDYKSKSSVDHFQQILIVKDGKPEKFKDLKVFQRRALVILSDGRSAIIESEKPASLAQFSHDLCELGADRALYVDMGAWDEGWYRYGNGIMTIGRMKSATERQSNWVILKD
jgi:hypothetical protein